MSKTTAIAIAVLNHQLGIAAMAAPTALTAHFATAAADAEAGSFTLLPTGNGYAPLDVMGKFSAAAEDPDGHSARSANTQRLTFGKATANLGRVTHLVLRDQAGTALRYIVLPGGGFDYNTDVEPYFEAGSLVCTED